MTFERITIRPDQMGGAHCIRGLRIRVATVVAMVADGMSRDEMLAAYPDLEPEGLPEALRTAPGRRTTQGSDRRARPRELPGRRLVPLRRGTGRRGTQRVGEWFSGLRGSSRRTSGGR